MEHLSWCYRGYISQEACEELKGKVRAVNEDKIQDHEVLAQIEMVGSSARQPISIM